MRFRFNKDNVVNVLHPLVEDLLKKNDQRGLPIPSIQKLMLALRFYATGNIQQVSGHLYGVSQATAGNIVHTISGLLAGKTKDFVKLPATEADCRKAMRWFYEIRGFPGVLACVDGTHIPIKNPGGVRPEICRNRHGWFSLNVQVDEEVIAQVLLTKPGLDDEMESLNSDYHSVQRKNHPSAVSCSIPVQAASFRPTNYYNLCFPPPFPPLSQKKLFQYPNFLCKHSQTFKLFPVDHPCPSQLSSFQKFQLQLRKLLMIHLQNHLLQMLSWFNHKMLLYHLLLDHMDLLKGGVPPIAPAWLRWSEFGCRGREVPLTTKKI
uniref:DDE Tnp4 domain-containing protein n=1 Tax=Timema tahoe TaxID=61484 RepID=A0A7R9NUT1_9NEOP|nr:unnamed protein product [Timema tahoe]